MEKMHTKASLRSLRIAPRKVRLLIDLIRGMNVENALVQLRFSKKDAAVPVRKLLESAIANAKHNHSMKGDSLVVKTAFVDGGPTLHRWKPRAMGRATPIRKRTSHITLVLEGEIDEKVVKAKNQEEKKDIEENKVVDKKNTEEKEPKADKKDETKKSEIKKS